MVDGWREVVLPASVVLSLIGVTVLLLWRRHPGGFLGAWIFVILAPTSSFFPIDDVIFEHRMYLPLAGVIVLAVMAVYEGLSACRSPSGRALVWARWIAMVFVASYIALTMLRNVDYRSERSLWSDVVRKQPDNLRARNDLAVAFCEQGDFEKANVHFDYVLRKTEGTTSKRVKKRMPYAIANNSPQFNRCRAFANRGVMESVRGRLDMAISNFVAAVEVYPYESDVLLKLRHTLLRTGIPPDKVDDEIHRLIRQEGN
jgi:tetratricopeptide (TPR) repeat protein